MESQRTSAGVLVWQARQDGGAKVLLAHMGGPFWARRDAGAWTIPKGLVKDGEDVFEAALREFVEETGIELPHERCIYRDLGEARTSGKRLRIFALEGDCETFGQLVPRSNLFVMEWPRGSGEQRSFPEVDRLACMPIEEARRRIVASQRVFLDRLERIIGCEHNAGQ